jgi:hypothetical protein
MSQEEEDNSRPGDGCRGAIWAFIILVVFIVLSCLICLGVETIKERKEPNYVGILMP